MQKYARMSDIIHRSERLGSADLPEPRSSAAQVKSRGQWQKRTAEDLSSVISNYQEIKSYLMASNESLLLQQLTSRHAEIF
jgi:hypothetical protein